jgi:branched-chain amino acid aminotransferase
MQLASIDGALGPAEEARIPITDDGLLRGDGAFEALRLYGGRPFALEEHLARLKRSCAGLRLEADHEALRAEIGALVAASGRVDAVLRVVLTRGGRRIALVEPLPPPLDAYRVATIRFAPGRVLDGLKTLSYGANMLAKRIAQEQGDDEALLVTPHGRVLEGPTWSFFWVRDGELLTPPLEDRILASITRAVIIQEVGAAEEPCTLEDAYAADEAFLASSIREVAPIATLDGRSLPAAPGEVTLRAQRALAQRIERELGAVA